MQHLVGRGRLHVGSLPRLHSETLSLKTNGCGGGGEVRGGVLIGSVCLAGARLWLYILSMMVGQFEMASKHPNPSLACSCGAWLTVLAFS